jgi:hypothetical protein
LKLVDTVKSKPFTPIGFAKPELQKDFASNGIAALPNIFSDILANAKNIPADNDRLLNSLQARVSACSSTAKETKDQAFIADLLIDQTKKLNGLIAPKMEVLLAATLPKFWEEQPKQVLADADKLGEATRLFITKAVVGARKKQNELLAPPKGSESGERRMASSPETHE